MAAHWYYRRNGEEHGPVSAARLRELAAAGKLLPTDLVRKDGMAKWVRAGQVKGLCPEPAPANDPVPTPAPAERQGPPPSPLQRAADWLTKAGDYLQQAGQPARPSPLARNKQLVFLVAAVGFAAILLVGLGAGLLTLSRDGASSIRELRRLDGHGGAITGVAISPDGRRALSAGGSQDKTVRLWDLETGRELRRFDGFNEPAGVAWSVAFSPDGRRAAAGGMVLDRESGQPVVKDGKPRARILFLWDVETGNELFRFTGETSVVLGLALSPDGRCAACQSLDKAIRLWDLDTGKELRRLEGHTSGGMSVAFSSDGRRLLSAGGSDRTVRLWDVETGREVRRIDGAHSAAVISVALSPDGRRALSGGGGIEHKDGQAVVKDDKYVWGDCTVKLWDLESGREVRRFVGHTGHDVVGVAFLPDGRRILSGSKDGTIRLWDLDTGKELSRVRVPSLATLTVSQDGRHALSGGTDKVVRLWKLPE